MNHLPHTDHFTNPPGRRIGSQARISNGKGKFLLLEVRRRVERGDTLTWNLPGGCAEAGEEPQDACRRRIREKTGLDIELGRLLVVHWQPPTAHTAEGYNFVWEGPTITAHTDLELLVSEVSDWRFMSRKEMTGKVPLYLEARFDAAELALRKKTTEVITGLVA
ncbi:NUDIX domain-containing protein [Streptomyces sp. WAC 06783]|uniref:NUDIX domain-containing protein n=1 Tax=Streptomyces sp. WAC 06783 TaxID=2203211 RepID=UPI00163CED40|nr:NUDIX hydrolase [Streptomyces sp. WAC 06783]